MPIDFITGSQGFSFKGIDLYGTLAEWSDTRKPVLATHRFLKRDGAKIEMMARDAHQLKVTLHFFNTVRGSQIIQSWRDKYLIFQSSIDSDPSGVLVHPVLGQMNATCQGIDGASMKIEDALDLYTVPTSFIENQVDTNVTAATGAITSNQQIIQTATDSLLSDVLAFAGAVNQAATFVSAAISYATAAVAFFTSGVPDPSLPQLLDTVATDAEATRTAVRADSAATSDAVTYPAIADIEQAYGACCALADAIQSAHPVMVQYTVPSTMHIATLAALFYGKDGRARIGEILGNNPGKIPNPSAINVGTQLTLALATVVAD